MLHQRSPPAAKEPRHAIPLEEFALLEELLRTPETFGGVDESGAVDEPTAIPPATLPISQADSPAQYAEAPWSELSPTRSAAGVPSSVKRRRLTRKTTVADELLPETRPEPDIDENLEGLVADRVFPSRRAWKSLNANQRYNFVYDRLRSFYATQVHGAVLPQQERRSWDTFTASQKQSLARKAFAELQPQTRIRYTRLWSRLSDPPKWVLPVVYEFFMNSKAATICKLKSKSALLTWMLPEGLVDLKPALSDKAEPTAASLEALVHRLRQLSDLRTLWQDVQEHGQKCLSAAGAADVAKCLEVCPDTFRLQGVVRLHIHMFLKSNLEDLALKHLPFYSFKGVHPHASATIGGVACGNAGRASWSGFFYCCVEDKLGTVFCEASKSPFKGFLVNPTWILNLFQSQKVTCVVARRLLVQCVNASRHRAELDSYEAALEKLAVEQAAADAAEQLKTVLREQKTYPEAKAFVEQFKEVAHRYKFLVLSGPSRVGKTAFARSLCDPGMETLEINCASGAEPDLRAYRLSRHGVLLFDEIVAEQVTTQRKLFQAQSAPVQMGCSATNCHSYSVFNWRKKLVLASNNWESSLAALTESDQDWIMQNSIVLRVTEPMWVE